MLILPFAAVFSQGLASPWIRWWILLGSVVPTIIFTLSLHVPLTARFLTFALLGCFISLLFMAAWPSQQGTGIEAKNSLTPLPCDPAPGIAK
jgi:hypothetical protein